MATVTLLPKYKDYFKFGIGQMHSRHSIENNTADKLVFRSFVLDAIWRVNENINTITINKKKGRKSKKLVKPESFYTNFLTLRLEWFGEEV
jgi:hypothetical protein